MPSRGRGEAGSCRQRCRQLVKASSDHIGSGLRPLPEFRIPDPLIKSQRLSSDRCLTYCSARHPLACGGPNFDLTAGRSSLQASDMGFTVSYQPSSGIEVKDEFGNDAIHDFLEGGVLKIVAPDGNKKVSFTAPNVCAIARRSGSVVSVAAQGGPLTAAIGSRRR